MTISAYLRHYIGIMSILCFFGNASAYANSSAPRLISAYENWQVVLFFDGDTKSCTLNNKASESIANAKKKKKEKADKSEKDKKAMKDAAHADSYFFITNWPSRKEYFALSARSNAFLLKAKPGWLLFPDNSRFALMQDDLYVRPDPKNRAKILRLLRMHDRLQMVNYDKNNQEIRTDFNLKGIDDALAALIRYCPLPK